MSTKDQKKSIKKLISLVGITSASVFVGLPVLAHTNSSSSRLDSFPSNYTQSVESTRSSKPLLAQGASGSGQTGTGGTGTSGTTTNQPSTGGTGTGQTGTGGTGTSGTTTNQPGTGGTGTGQTGTGQTGTGGTGTSGTTTNQPSTGGTGTGQTGTGGTGTSGTTTNQPSTGGTGTGQTGTGTGQTGTGGTGTGQLNGQQGTFEENMRAGYTATQQRDYPTALAYFQRALQLRPGNSYATQAISNVQGYIQRDATTTPTNQSNR